jgi:hypothetical protein
MRAVNDSRGNPPPWAAFFSPQAWAHFIVIVSQDLTARGLSHELHAYEGFVFVGPEKNRLGLMNLAQMCHAASFDRWPAIVNHHFTVGIAPDGPVRRLLEITGTASRFSLHTTRDAAFAAA